MNKIFLIIAFLLLYGNLFSMDENQIAAQVQRLQVLPDGTIQATLKDGAHGIASLQKDNCHVTILRDDKISTHQFPVAMYLMLCNASKAQEAY